MVVYSTSVANEWSTACGVCEYNSCNANSDSLCDVSTAPIGSLGLGKLLPVPDITPVEG